MTFPKFFKGSRDAISGLLSTSHAEMCSRAAQPDASCWCDEVYQRWRDFDCVQLFSQMEKIRGEGTLPAELLVTRTRVLNHMHWSISNHVELWALSPHACMPVHAPYFYASHASASSACHLMLLYSTSSCGQTPTLHLQ